MHKLILLAAFLVACSASTSEWQVGGDAAVQDAADASSSGDSAIAGLLAPTIVRLDPMTGGLHVTWVNNQQDCDAIEGERKSGADAYKLVFTVPDGSVDNKHDGPLTTGTAYTYRVRCKRGRDESPDSAEDTGTP
jgi:hypothetical protein